MGAHRITRGEGLVGKLSADKADGVKAATVILPQYVVLTVPVPLNADLGDGAIFIADRAYRVVQVDEVHAVAGSDGGAVTLDVKKQVGTEAPTAGVTVLSSTFNAKSTANTVVSKTAGAGLTATAADRELAAGNRLSVDLTGVLTALAGVCVTLKLQLI